MESSLDRSGVSFTEGRDGSTESVVELDVYGVNGVD